MITYEEAIDLHSNIHLNDTKFNGYSIAPHIPLIANIMENSNIKTILDFGCGKAKGWHRSKFHIILNTTFDNVTLYDPCVPDYKIYPEGKFDLVICTDVMEHIPEEAVGIVLSQIFEKAQCVVFLSISTRLASKWLDKEKGLNAHLTVKPEEWWIKQINQANINHIYTKVVFND